MNELAPLKFDNNLSTVFTTNNGKRGSLIAIEGIDGSGKTTLTTAIAERLNQSNKTATVFRTSSGNTQYWNTVMDFKRTLSMEGKAIPPEIDQCLHTFEFITYCSKILPIVLNEFEYVLADRYFLGKIVISRTDTKIPGSYSEVLISHAINTQYIPTPDYVIYLDTPIKLAQKRILDRGEPLEFKETEEMLKLATIEFKNVLKGKNYYSGKVLKISTNDTVENLVDNIVSLINK